MAKERIMMDWRNPVLGGGKSNVFKAEKPTLSNRLWRHQILSGWLVFFVILLFQDDFSADVVIPDLDGNEVHAGW